MPRERQFTDAEVLDAATDVFSAHGFQGTSLAMLMDATGLGKQSLYNAFGDKRELYLKAVDCAVARFGALRLAMRDAPSGRAAVQRFFEQLLDLCGSPEASKNSCIVSAGLLEDAPDPTIRRHLLDKWRNSHELLREALERGQKDGSIASRLPSAQLADLLMNLMSGLRVSARAGLDPDRLAAVASLGLRVLDSA